MTTDHTRRFRATCVVTQYGHFLGAVTTIINLPATQPITVDVLAAIERQVKSNTNGTRIPAAATVVLSGLIELEA